MMRNKMNEQIEILKNILKGKFKAKQIYIFGSNAYGTLSDDSDIDLCIITDFHNKRKIDVMREIRRELVNFISLPLDILVYSENEFMERANLNNTLEYKILNDGIKIYG